MNEEQIYRKVWLAIFDACKETQTKVTNNAVYDFIKCVEKHYIKSIDAYYKYNLINVIKEQQQIFLEQTARHKDIEELIKTVYHYKTIIAKKLGIYQEQFQTFDNIVENIEILQRKLKLYEKSN